MAGRNGGYSMPSLSLTAKIYPPITGNRYNALLIRAIGKKNSLPISTTIRSIKNAVFLLGLAFGRGLSVAEAKLDINGALRLKMRPLKFVARHIHPVEVVTEI